MDRHSHLLLPFLNLRLFSSEQANLRIVHMQKKQC